MEWDKLTDEQWEDFAKMWLDEQRRDRTLEDSGNSDIINFELMLNFIGSSAANWKFILTTMDLAENDKELGALAAGSLENFIWRYGESYIDEIESTADKNQKFNRLLTGVWNHRIKDEIWERIKILQRRVKDPLPEYQGGID